MAVSADSGADEQERQVDEGDPDDRPHEFTALDEDRGERGSDSETDAEVEAYLLMQDDVGGCASKPENGDDGNRIDKTQREQ